MTAGFAVTISAVDNVTKSIDQINRKFASMTAPVTRLNASIKKFTDVSGISKMSAGVEKLSSGITGFARSASLVVPSLGVITSAASVAGLVELTEKFAQFGSQLGFASQNIGIQVGSLAALQGAAMLAGSSSASLTSGMLNLSQSITDAAGGRNMAALGYFRQLGINIRDTNGALRKADQVLPDVADGIAKISNPALQRRVAAAFGFSDDMLPFLRRGSKGLQEYEAMARRYGAIDAAGAAAARTMGSALDALTYSTFGLGNAVAIRLAPVLTPMLTDLANWTAAHRTDIADTVGGIAKQFKDWAENGGLKKLGTDLDSTAKGIDSVAQAMGGWKTTLEVVGGVLALRFLAPLTGIISAMARLALMFPEIALPAAVTAAAGAEAGRLNMPMLDDYGRSVGSWSGGDGSGPSSNVTANPNKGRTIAQAVSDWWHGSSATPGAAGLGVSGQDYSKFRQSIAIKERSAYSEMGGSSNRFAGKYQMGGEEIALAAKRLGEATPSTSAFLSDPSMQERYFDAYTAMHNDQLMTSSPQYRGMTPQQRLQALAYAHNQGAGGAATWLRTGVSGVDAFGTSGASYASEVAKREGQPVINGPYSSSAAAPGASGTVKVEIVNRNAPAGTSMTATTTGNVTASGRVETSSLLRPH